MEVQVRRIKNILRSEFYTVNDAWLTECVEYYVSEHDNPPDNEVYEFVKSQWLLSDLRKINSEDGCLPNNLAEKLFTVLRGTYILQMNKMYDIATSKYKQIQDIRSVSNANIEATEEQNEPGWIPKKRRMLQMYLTDGVQDIIAIEYQPMPSLNSMLLPGYKVMIVGPVNCRRGVILLENKNFKEVGGEEESLLICNALENVLARALGIQENPDPYNDKKETKKQQSQNTVADQDAFDEEFDVDIASTMVETNTVIAGRDSTQRTQNQRTGSRADKNDSNRSAPLNTNFLCNKSKKRAISDANNFIVHHENVIDLSDSEEFNVPTTSTEGIGNYGKGKQLWCNSSSSTVRGNKSSQAGIDGIIKSTTIIHDVEFPEDDFDFSDFDVISANVENKRTNESGAQKQSSAALNQYSVNDNNIQETALKSGEFPDDDFDFDDFDVVSANPNENVRQSLVTNQESMGQKNTAISSNISNTSNAHAQAGSTSFNEEENKPCPVAMSNLSIRNSPGTKPSISGIALKPREVKMPTGMGQDDFPDDEFDFDDFDVMPRDVESNCKSIGTSSKKLEEKAASNSALSRKPATKSQEGSNDISSLDRKYTEANSKYRIVESSETPVSPVRSNLPQKAKVLTHGNVPSSAEISPISTGGKRAAVSPPSVSPQKVRCLQETPKQMRSKPLGGKNMKMSDFLQKVSPLSVPPKICDFLCEFVNETVTDVVFKTVRAQVSGMGKLSKKDTCWLLNGTITDGTACLEVTFANELLEKLLGFTTTEFSQRKKLKRTNPEIDQELRAIFRNAEHTLKSLDALVELQLRPNEKARAISIKELTAKQKEAIDKRLKLLRM